MTTGRDGGKPAASVSPKLCVQLILDGPGDLKQMNNSFFLLLSRKFNMAVA